MSITVPIEIDYEGRNGGMRKNSGENLDMDGSLPDAQNKGPSSWFSTG